MLTFTAKPLFVRQGSASVDGSDKNGLFTRHDVIESGVIGRVKIAFDLYFPDLSNTKFSPTTLQATPNIPNVFFDLCFQKEFCLIGHVVWEKYTREIISTIHDYKNYQSVINKLCGLRKIPKYQDGKKMWPMRIALISKHFKLGWGNVSPILTAYVGDAVEQSTICLGRELLRKGLLVVDDEKTGFFPNRTS